MRVEPPGHLPLDDLCLRVVGAAGIDQPRDLGMAGKRFGDLAGGPGLPLDADRQGLEGLQQHPGIERRHGRAGLP
jgi:hypothetical protein